jgi:hypothetical protein
MSTSRVGEGILMSLWNPQIVTTSVVLQPQFLLMSLWNPQIVTTSVVFGADLSTCLVHQKSCDKPLTTLRTSLSLRVVSVHDTMLKQGRLWVPSSCQPRNLPSLVFNSGNVFLPYT